MPEDRRLERAAQYLAKVPPAVSGQGGHNQTFAAACRVLLGFDLNYDEALPLFQEWNTKCQPPWTARELEHKLQDALKQGGERGFLLGNEKSIARKRVILPSKSQESPAAKLRDQLDAAITGARFALEWPWPALSRLSKALLPGTITVFCAPQGASKSFFMLEAAALWLLRRINVAVLELEDDRTFHLRRALAQQADNANLTDDSWCKRYPEEVKSAWEKHAALLELLGRSIHEAPKQIDVDVLLAWVEREADSNRVLIIDPISAKDPTARPWIDDHRFVMEVKNIIKNRQTSLVLVTHPPKQSGFQRRDGMWGDDVAGGAAYLRFTHTILYLEFLREQEEIDVRDANGLVASAIINRRLQLRKTRNGRGAGTTLGYFFDARNLRHYERGIERK